MRTDYVHSLAKSPHHPYSCPDFFPIFFIWNYKIYHIWQFLVFIPVTGFQCHSVPVNSRDCSGEITRISKFRGRSEILAGKFHWNGTGICRNDRNPAGICGASLRPWNGGQEKWKIEWNICHSWMKSHSKSPESERRQEWSICQMEWRSICDDLTWNRCHEWMKFHFISFVVVDQDIGW